MLEIQPVQTKKQQKDFILFPWKVYEGDTNWVPPLILDMKRWFKTDHPFYEYGEQQFFLAIDSGKVVGRIAAIDNPLHNEHHEGKTGFFGFFECFEDQNVANALFDRAANWLRNRGLTTVEGPASPSSNYDYGLLTKGFEDPPRILMTYNPPYYEKLIKGYGFEKVKTLYAYKINAKKAFENERLQRLSTIVKQRTGVTIRKMNLKRLKEEMIHVKKVYNEAWEANWGHIPFTDREINQLGEDLKPLGDRDFLLFAEINGEVIGKGLAVLDANFILQQMNGRLFPFNFLKIFTQKKHIKWVRVLTLGVVPKHRNKGIDALLCYELLKAASQKGILYGEGSWILEDNVMMNRAMENFDGEVYKHYAIYKKDL